MKPDVDRSAVPMLVVTFYPTLTAAEARAHFQEMIAAAKELGQVGVVIDLSDAPRPTPSVWRVGCEAMRGTVRHYAESCVGVAHVVRSAAARSMLAAVQWLVPPPFPTLVTSSMVDARSWVLTQLGRSAHPAGLVGRLRRDTRTTAGLARAMMAAAKRLDVPLTDADLEPLGLVRARVGELDAYTPFDATTQLCELLALRSADVAFGLRVGAEFVDASSFGVVGIAAGSSTNLGEALSRLVHHASLVDENAVMTMTRDADGVRIVFGPLTRTAWPRHHAELMLAALLTLVRTWTGVPLDARAAGFRHASPGDVSAHARTFGCTPHFQARENFIVLPAKVLTQKLRHADALQARYFDVRLDELARSRGAGAGPLADVRSEISRQLVDGSPTLASIAAGLAMSGRTLQRRLNRRGVTFGDVLDSARREAAMAAIPRPGASVQDVASSAGFIDVKAFRRAFVRWTGKSPRDYRQTLR